MTNQKTKTNTNTNIKTNTNTNTNIKTNLNDNARNIAEKIAHENVFSTSKAGNM